MNFKNQLWTDGSKKKILEVLINLKHYSYNEKWSIWLFFPFI